MRLAGGSSTARHGALKRPRPRLHLRQSSPWLWILVAVAAGLAGLLAVLSSGSQLTYDAKADCVSVGSSVKEMRAFEQLVGRSFNCAVVFNDAAPNWAGWEAPWFLSDPDPYNWRSWVDVEGSHRQLIISQSLFPSELAGSDWLVAGAAGAYVRYARTLARNLIAAGLGNSVIRLAHEANDSRQPYAVATSRRGQTLWAEFWRRTVIAMRSVPGAHFLFDWCVNAYWRPIPLGGWYPGDKVVNIIGIDAYDGGVPRHENRWRWLYTEPDGIRAILRFAAAHSKPVSIPEWGLVPADSGSRGGGDDPAYVDGIARVVRDHLVAYQAYFYVHDSAALLGVDRRSLVAYRRHFGANGDSANARTITAVR
jgi:Glycosyl hydrolase family 26